MAQLAGTFKRYTRDVRELHVEEAFTLGMQYSLSALDTGYARLIVNYDYNRMNFAVKPRGGLQTVDLISINDLPNTYQDAYRLSTFMVYTAAYTSFADDTATQGQETRNRVIVLGQGTRDYENIYITPRPSPHEDGMGSNRNLYSYRANTLIVLMRIDDKFVECHPSASSSLTNVTIYDPGLYGQSQMHGLPVEFYASDSLPYAVLNGTGYVFIRDSRGPEATTGIGYFVFEYRPTTGYTYDIKLVEAMTPSPQEAVATGYNMSLSDPYQFTVKSGATWSIDGIVPYDLNDQILLSSRDGQMLRFKAYYTYNSSDASKTIRPRWEWADPAIGEWNLIQTQAQDPEEGQPISPSYTPGQPIVLDWTPTVKVFQLRVSLYLRSGSTTDAKPVRVGILPSYTVGANAGSSTRNVQPLNYNIFRAQGMLAWKQRLVLWNIPGGENILFMSDTNNPAYFPYPNNTTLFDETILHVVEYLDKLLIFTESRVYTLSVNAEGTGFTPALIQDKMNISVYETHLIRVYRNMVFYKSGNYYYMIVPKTTSIIGELTIAPISNPMRGFFNDFEKAIRDIIERLYPDVFNQEKQPYYMRLVKSYSYAEDTAIHMVYCLQTFLEYSGGEDPEDPEGPRRVHLTNYIPNPRTPYSSLPGSGDPNIWGWSGPATGSGTNWAASLQGDTVQLRVIVPTTTQPLPALGAYFRGFRIRPDIISPRPERFRIYLTLQNQLTAPSDTWGIRLRWREARYNVPGEAEQYLIALDDEVTLFTSDMLQEVILDVRASLQVPNGGPLAPLTVVTYDIECYALQALPTAVDVGLRIYAPAAIDVGELQTQGVTFDQMDQIYRDNRSPIFEDIDIIVNPEVPTDPVAVTDFNFDMVYDTATRAWRLWTHQTNGMLTPYRQTITGFVQFIDAAYSQNQAAVQLVEFQPEIAADRSLLYHTQESNLRRVRNYQFLDTGYRNIDPQFNKRFREIQTRFLNTEAVLLDFYLEFYLDEDRRKTFHHEKLVHVTDPTSRDYGLIYFDAVEIPQMTIGTLTQFAESNEDNKAWRLDMSRFPQQAIVRLRMQVSGKGRLPRLTVLSRNEHAYDLININWVYRPMYAR